MLALGEIQTRPIGENPSRACLVLPGALRICVARCFTTPSRQQGLDIDRAITLTGTSRIFDEASAGQSARMPAKLCPTWLSAIQLLVAPDKSVKTCQEFRQGSVKDGQGFHVSECRGSPLFLDEVASRPHARSSISPCWLWTAGRAGRTAAPPAVQSLSRILTSVTTGPDCRRRSAQQCPGE